MFFGSLEIGKLRPLFLILSVGLFSSTCVAQYEGKAILWRGFEFRWLKTNHRLNSFGSWANTTFSGIVTHNRAQSGSASDSWFYRNHWTYIKSDLTQFSQFSKQYHLYGSKGSMIRLTDTIYLAATQLSEELFLNGFEITNCAGSDPDKLSYFAISIDTTYKKSNSLIVVFSGAFQFYCTKPKCKLFKHYECNDDSVDYNLNCIFLRVMAPAEMPSDTVNNFEGNLKWQGRGGALLGEWKPGALRGDGKAGIVSRNKIEPWSDEDTYDYPQWKRRCRRDGCEIPLTGIKSFSLDVTSENHLCFWSTFIGTCNDYGFMYDYYSNMEVDSINAGLYYSPWRLNPNPIYRLFSKSNSGSAKLNLTTKTIWLDKNHDDITNFKTFVAEKYNAHKQEISAADRYIDEKTIKKFRNITNDRSNSPPVLPGLLIR